MLPMVDQHELMTRVLCEAGASSIEDALPAGYQGKRADVVFEHENVIVEVKTIATDRAVDPKTADALGIMFSESISIGAPEIFGQVQVRLHDLPRPVAEKALRIVGRRIQHEAKGANRQLKASKSVLGRPDAYGLLVFVTPPYRIDRRSIGWLMADRLRGGTCQSISGIMIVETPIAVPNGMASAGNSFLSFHSRHERVLSEDLRLRISRAWGVVTGQQGRPAPEEDFFRLGATA